MSADYDPTAEVWIRSVRGLPESRGPWHMRNPNKPSWNKVAMCGVYPTQRHETRWGRPSEGKFCSKCLATSPAAPVKPRQERTMAERCDEHYAQHPSKPHLVAVCTLPPGHDGKHSNVLPKAGASAGTPTRVFSSDPLSDTTTAAGGE